MLLTGISLLLFSAGVYAENQLNNVKVAALPDDQIVITLEFDSAP